MTQEEIDQEVGSSWRMLLETLRDQGFDISEVVFKDEHSGNTFAMPWETLQRPSGVSLLMRTMRAMRGVRGDRS
jgi:hypothetical protein